MRYNFVEYILFQREVFDLIRLIPASGIVNTKTSEATHHAEMHLPEFPQCLLDFLTGNEDRIFSGHPSIFAEFVKDIAKRDVRRIVL